MHRSDAESCKLFEKLKVQFQEINLELRLQNGGEFAAYSGDVQVFCCANLSTAGGWYRCVKEIQMGTIAVEKRGVRLIEPLKIKME